MNPTEMDAAHWAFLHFYFMDKANACYHCAPVKFSPLTFRLADILLDNWPEDEDITQELAEVKNHKGRYTLDEGR